MKHQGNLTIRTQADADRYSGLTEVSGDLYIYAEAKLDAPKLESVGGDLYIYAEAKLDALKSVGGDLYINAEAKLDAPKLYSKGFDNFKVYDGIACVVISTKTKNGIDVLSCRQAKIKQQKLIGEKLFVAKKGSITAHAADLKTALEELTFKLGDRNVDQYKNMPKHTRKSPEDWAFIYRMVTGACQYGTKQFMEAKGKLKRTYTLAEILTETKGAYGHDKFQSVVAEKAA
jgi:hypothetical protein